MFRANIPRTVLLKPLALLALLCLPGVLFSQPPPQDRQRFRLDVDAAIFSGSDSLGYVEVYYGILESGLSWAPAGGGGLHGAVALRLSVSDSSHVIASRNWVIPRTLADSQALGSGKSILSVEPLALPAGAYRVTLVAGDSADPARADSATIPVRVSLPAAGVSLSGIELCTRLAPSSNTSSPFYKNTLEAVPNPARLYGEGLAVVHFYLEVYGLDQDPGPPAVLRVSIIDAGGREVKTQAKPKPRTSPSSVEYGSMNVSSLPGGTYVLRVSVDDTAAASTRTLATAEKKFFVVNPAVEATGGLVATPAAFALMTEQEADEEIRKVRYIASDPERRQAEQLSGVEAKRNHLAAFWKGRREAATAAGFDPREGYLRKVAEADEKFTERSQQGWLTDRGRVWILYGPPDNVERYPSTPESRPYEVWQYNAVQGGVVFVFVDRLGFGTYRLVHSTHMSELRDDDWYVKEAQVR